jgi:hypothetical protein
MPQESRNLPTVFVRDEDRDHPKLSKLSRMLPLESGAKSALQAVWVAWGAGLSRDWLMARLEAKGHVLILPPWPFSDFAGLPAVRGVPAPGNQLVLNDTIYHVAAPHGIEEDSSWKAEGRFHASRIAWLASREPFAGAGKAWLCTAELLLANPATRPRDVSELVRKIVMRMAGAVSGDPKAEIQKERKGEIAQDTSFHIEDVPYLLALLPLDSSVKPGELARIVKDRFRVAADEAKAEAVLSLSAVQEWLLHAPDERKWLFEAIDALGYRSFRLELMEGRT